MDLSSSQPRVTVLHAGGLRVTSERSSVRRPLMAVPSPGLARPSFTCLAPSHPSRLSRVSLLHSGLLSGASASMRSFYFPLLVTPLVLPCSTSHDL